MGGFINWSRPIIKILVDDFAQNAKKYDSFEIYPGDPRQILMRRAHFSLKSYKKYAKFSVAMWDVAMFHVTTKNTPPTKEPTQVFFVVT